MRAIVIQVPRYLVCLRSSVWPNLRGKFASAAVEFGSAAVCDQMNLKSISMALS